MEATHSETIRTSGLREMCLVPVQSFRKVMLLQTYLMSPTLCWLRRKQLVVKFLASAKVTDNTVKPVVTATVTPANCNPANSGSASAKVGNVTNGYDFYWYNGSSVKPTSDFSGSTYSNISAGDYTVVATQKSTGCSSMPVIATVVSKAIVPVTATVTSHQTSCSTPTGAASASVSGSTAGYTFKWFKGNNTLAANLIGSSSTIAGVAAGVYTVEATNTSNGCIDTEIVTINDTYANPVVTAATTTANTNCTGITPNGSDHDQYRWSCSCSRTIYGSMVRRKWHDYNIRNNRWQCNRSKQYNGSRTFSRNIHRACY